MSERNLWADEYGIRLYYDSTPPISLAAAGVGANATVFNTATADADAFENDGSMGVDVNLYGMQLTNHPDLMIDLNVINQRKAMGTSYRNTTTGGEYQQGNYTPTSTWEFDATKKNLAVFLWLLFQEGMTEGADPFLKTYVPYAEGTEEVTVAAALIRKLSGSEALSHVFGGCIVKSLTITGDEGQPIKCSAELIGYNGVTDFDFDADVNIIEYDNTAPLMFSDLTVKLATTAVNIPKFNFTITNNATQKFYDTQHPVKYVLNDFTVEGSITIPWAATTVGGNAQLNNFIAGTDALLQLYWGNESPSADGDVKFEINCRYTGAPLGGDDEIVSELSFDGAYDGTYQAIRVYVCDDIERKVNSL